MKVNLKARKMILFFRMFAMYDVLFKGRFEIQTWNKDGSKASSTKFDKNEILEKL